MPRFNVSGLDENQNGQALTILLLIEYYALCKNSPSNSRPELVILYLAQ
jgi:hypothetical protein